MTDPTVLIADQESPLAWIGGLDPDPRHVPEDPRVPHHPPVLRPSRPWGCVLAVLASLAAWAALIVLLAAALAAPRSGQTTVGPTPLGGTTAGAGDPTAMLTDSSAGQSGAPHSPVAPGVWALSSAPRSSAGGAGTASAPAVITGTATWYDAPTARDAAAGPALRRALGRGWRDSTVQVCGKSTCIEVVLSDWCACGHGHVIDLDDRAFAQLAPLSQGVVRVTITAAGLRRPTPPPTDVWP